MDRRLPQPYAAYVRVYEPIGAFEGADRAWWEGYAVHPSRPSRAALMVKEQEAARGRVACTPPIVAPAQESREAYTLRFDGADGGDRREPGLFVCPRDDRLRAFMALNDLRSGLPPEIVESFLLGPEGPWADEAGGDPGAGAAAGPGSPPGAGPGTSPVPEDVSERRAPHILTSTWHVPPRWFVMVSAEERHLELFEADPSCLYRTRMVDARRRVARTLRALRRSVDESGVTDGLDDLGRWLEEFHPHSWIELDYGGLAGLFTAAELEADESPADIAAAVAAIVRGDSAAASAAYARLVTRWETVRRLERAS